jgi:signal peptidase I
MRLIAREQPLAGPVNDVTGRAFVISWSASHWTWLSDYPNVFDGMDDHKK